MLFANVWYRIVANREFVPHDSKNSFADVFPSPFDDDDFDFFDNAKMEG